MKLMTKAIAAKLFEADTAFIASGKTPQKVVVKYFDPCGAATWHIVQGTPLEGRNGAITEDWESADDWHLFGLCDLGMGFPELGYVLLSELVDVRGPLGIGIERDLGYSGTLKQAQGLEDPEFLELKEELDVLMANEFDYQAPIPAPAMLARKPIDDDLADRYGPAMRAGEEQ